MKTAPKLALFAAALVLAGSAAFGVARLANNGAGVQPTKEGTMDPHGGHASPGATGVKGLSLSADGYVLSAVEAPARARQAGELRFRIDTASGTPFTDFAVTHEKRMHLIVVRTDGVYFRHVHPVLDSRTGTWSIPWRWTNGGNYRLYADFLPAGGSGVTLSRSVDVAGGYAPADPTPNRSSAVDDYAVRLAGDLVAGQPSTLTLTLSRDGQPVTRLQPYLGAFGHLVALRQGDLAFLHVHPEGIAPTPGATGGPDIQFVATAPTAGRYLLYLDFQIAGKVRTATFVVDAGHPDGHSTPSAGPSARPSASPGRSQHSHDDGHGG